MRTPAARVKPRTAKIVTYPAPVGGWIKNQNLAIPGARRPDGSAVNGAAMLENWFPIATGVRMRAGSELYQIIGDGSLDIASMFTYVDGNNAKFFAAIDTGIYDITTPTMGPSPVVGSLTSGAWSFVQFATPGGVFLRGVNGADTPRVFDGSSWSTSPAITGVTATSLSYVFTYKQRLFFIESGSLNAWYLPVDSIGGAAVQLPLGGIFSRGGSLLFGASWSLDGGGGLSAQCIFVTTEGEVAVYQGSDPSVSNSWSLVGVYRIGKPLGPKAWIHAGGDLVIATDIGFIPLSQAVQRDYAALSPSAISYPIETAWNEEVADRSGANWNCEVWPTKQMVVVALPTVEGTTPEWFVANARTGAWAPYTGWDATCVQLFGTRLFYGSTAGNIIEAEVTGQDQGSVFVSTCVPLFDPLKNPASLKTGMSARATLLSPLRVAAGLSFQHDYSISLPVAPDDIVVPPDSTWDVGIWGTSKWGAPSVKQTFQEWKSIGGSGYAVAPAVQISSGNIVPPDVELVSIDMTYELSDIVT